MTIKPPSGFALQQAVATLQRALADEPDQDGVLASPAEATEDVEELLNRVLRAAVEADAMADMASERIKAMTERKARYMARNETLRATAFAAMDVLELRTVELPDLTASIKQNAPRVVITDETLIPTAYLRVSVVPDKAEIKEALKSGPVPGATLTNSLPSISIRVR